LRGGGLVAARPRHGQRGVGRRTLTRARLALTDRKECLGIVRNAAACAISRTRRAPFVMHRALPCRIRVVGRREYIGIIETFRCELIGCNISCSRCHKKAPGSLTIPGACCESLPQLLRLLDSAAGVSGMGLPLCRPNAFYLVGLFTCRYKLHLWFLRQSKAPSIGVA
jgi:hypothetical protein